MNKPKVLAALAFVFFASGAHAMNGNDLVSRLQSKDPAIVLQAHTYVAGVLDSETTFLTLEKFALGGSKDKKMSFPHFCMPDGTTARKVVDVISPRLEAEPQIRQQNANILVRRALIEVWPCSNNP